MNTKKEAISLIILVITIITLTIVATTVIISLDNNSIIETSNDVVSNQNVTSLAQSVELVEMDFMLKNKGKTPIFFELLDAMSDKNVITEEQKTELIQKNGKIDFGNKKYSMDKSSVMKVSDISCTMQSAGGRIRFETELYKTTEDVEYIEFGYIVKTDQPFIALEGTLDDNFTFEGAEANGITLATGGSTSSSFKVTEETSEKYVFALALNEIAESNMDTNFIYRGYLKYKKDGVEGILYSDIAINSCNDLL